MLAARLAENLSRERRSLIHTLVFIALALAVQHAARWMPDDLGSIVEPAALLAVGIGAIKLAGSVLVRLAVPMFGVVVPRIVEDIAVVAGSIAWGMVRLRVAGVDPASIVTTSALITGLVAFSMQDTLGNVLGGVLLELEDSVTLGDWVRLDEVTGRVIEIRWRHTTLRTTNGERLVVPNALLIKSRFTLLGNPEDGGMRVRRWIWFHVDFDVPAQRVLAAGQEALATAEVANVARDSKGDCVLMDLNLGQGHYALRYWLSDPQHADSTDSLMRVHLLAALERAGIVPSIPKELSFDAMEHEKKVQARETSQRIAALRKVDLFTPLADAELRALARHLVRAPFVAGEVITRQGATAHWLYLLVSGSAEVWVESAGAARRRVAVLEPGTVFGEMGMLTGEPRRATVAAATDVMCYRLDKPGFQEIIEARPSLARAMSEVLATRASGLTRVLEQTPADSPQAPERTLLERIEAFFGIDSRQNAPRRAA